MRGQVLGAVPKCALEYVNLTMAESLDEACFNGHDCAVGMLHQCSTRIGQQHLASRPVQWMRPALDQATLLQVHEYETDGLRSDQALARDLRCGGAGVIHEDPQARVLGDGQSVWGKRRSLGGHQRVLGPLDRQSGQVHDSDITS